MGTNKQAVLWLSAAAGAVLALLSGIGAEDASWLERLTGPGRRLGEWLRELSLSGAGGNLAAWALVMLLPGPMIRIFNDEADLLAAGIPALRVYFATFFCMSFQFIGQSVFVGLGRSKNAVFFSLLRKAFIVAPLTLLLPALGMGVNGVFVAEPISNVLGGLACLLTMYAVVYRPLGKLKS